MDVLELAEAVAGLDVVQQVLVVAGGSLVVAGMALYVVLVALKRGRE